HSLNKLLCIFCRVQLKERLSEACGAGRCRLCDHTLWSCQLSCEYGQEVVLCLLRCQCRYRRKYAECVSGQEDHVLRCRSCGYRAHDFLNMVDRIGYTCVLCHALICEVDLSVLVKSHVLKKRVSLDRV